MALKEEVDMVVIISTLVTAMEVTQTIVIVQIQMENVTATTQGISEAIIVVKMETAKLQKAMDPELVDTQVIIRISETEKIAAKDKEKVDNTKIAPSVQRKNERNYKNLSIIGISLLAT